MKCYKMISGILILFLFASTTAATNNTLNFSIPIILNDQTSPQGALADNYFGGAGSQPTFMKGWITWQRQILLYGGIPSGNNKLLPQIKWFNVWRTTNITLQ